MTRDHLDFTGTERFEIRRRIGAGSMGVVYEAYDRDTKEPVALKTLNRRRTDARALARLKSEFRLIQDIEHPNLVRLGELIEDGGNWFFTMELIEGEDFISSIRHAEPPGFDEARLRDCLKQLASALAAVHAAGIVHRDIKPGNVTVTPAGRVVLLDFGLAVRRESTDHSSDGDFVGTAVYMAPEQALSKDGSAAADWYAFGVVLYETLTGRRPYTGETSFKILMNKQRYAPPPPRALIAAVPPDLDGLCVDLLSVAPDDRPTGPQVLDRLGVDYPASTVETAINAAASRTQTPPFVGRQAELAVLREAFAKTQAGQAQTVLVRGESGIGKSALIREFTEALGADDASVALLAGRCYERESVPFKAFDGVIDALSRNLRRRPMPEVAALLPRNAALLPRVFPALGRVEAISCAPVPPGGVASGQELRARVFRALRELLCRVAETQPLVVVIDDLQWSDADSWLLMDDLLDSPDPPAMLLLASARCEVGSDEAYELAALLPAACTPIDLRPLEPQTARRLAKLLLQRASSGESPAHIAVEANGHPLYIDELVRYTLTAGSAREVLRLDDAIRQRVSALPEPARRLLELVVLAGTPLPRGIVAEAARMAHDVFDKHVSRLRLGHLVRTGGRRASDSIEPYHDRVREAVYEAIDTETRQKAHRRLAFVLEGEPNTPAEQVLYQLEAGGQLDKAAQLAETAAAQAVRGLAFDRAAELYGAAIRLGNPEPAHRAELQLRQAEALVNAGRGPEAAELFLSVARDADPAMRLECRRQAADQLIITGHLERGLAVLAELLGEIGVQLPSTPRRALAAVVWHRIRLRLTGLSFRPRHETEIAGRELTRIDVLRAAGLGLAMIDTIRGSAFNARHLRTALAAGETSRLVPALGMEATYLASQGARGRARARKIRQIVVRIADQTGHPEHRAWAFGIEGTASYFGGDFDRAAETLAEATTILRTIPGKTWESNNMYMFYLFSLRLGGRIQRFRALYAECVRDAARRGDRYLETTARRYGSFLWLCDDDPQSAVDSLERADWTPPAGRFHLQHWYELEARAEIALYSGRVAAHLDELLAAFARLDKSLLLRVQTVRVMSRWLRGRLHLALGEDLTPVARIRRQLAKERTPYADVFCALLHAGLAAKRGQRGTAADKLRGALAEADAVMPLHAACARRQLGVLLAQEGAELVADADVWLGSQGVQRPDAFTAMLVPGFDEPGGA